MTLTVKHNGTQIFTADGLIVIGGEYNFIDNTPPPPPQGRLTQALVTWQTHDPFTQNTDLTKYKNVAGVISRGQVPIDWPYVSGAQYKFACPAGKYVALEINVPANAPMTSHYVGSASYSGSAPLRISISRTAGDFNPATALKVIENVTPENASRLWFRNGPGTSFYVGLDGGGTYFVNVQPMDPTGTRTIGLASQ